MKRTILSVGIAIAAMAVSTGMALAVDAVVTRDSAVYRSRTSDRVVNEVERNQIVEVEDCRGSRCLIRVRGPDGWMRRDRLRPLDDYEYEDDYEDEDEGATPGITLDFNFGGGGISIGGGGVSIGGGNNNGGGNGNGGGGSQQGPDNGPRVCLFNGEGYTGNSRCFPAGTQTDLVSSGWNDRASSIRVHAGGKVTLCTDVGGGGGCYDFTDDSADLGGFDNQASYLHVFQ